MNDKIYVGFTSDQLNLIHQLLENAIEEYNNFEDENEDYNNLLKETLGTILEEVQ